MAKKTFRVTFPVYATGFDTVDIDESELDGKSELEIKELLVNKIGNPSVCHHCSDSIEEIEFDGEAAGENLENISFWEEEEG